MQLKKRINSNESNEKTDFIKKAYNVIYKTYSLDKTVLFQNEGVYYFTFYFQYRQNYIKRYQDHSSFHEIKAEINARCFSAKLMFRSYQ